MVAIVDWVSNFLLTFLPIKGEYVLLRVNAKNMGLHESGEIQEIAEQGQETNEISTSGILDALRDFAGSRVRILALMGAIATPLAVADCAQDPQVVKAPETTADYGLTLSLILSQDKLKGVTVNSNLNEPLTYTHFDLLDADKNLLYSGDHSIEVGGDQITFVDAAHARGSEIAVEDGDLIRFVVAKGRDGNGNLVQTQIPINSAALDDTDPFPNE